MILEIELNLFEFGGLCVIGVAAVVIQSCIIRAFSFENAGKIAMMNYSQIVTSMMIDFFIFDFIPDGYSILGGILVSSSIIVLIKRTFMTPKK